LSPPPNDGHKFLQIYFVGNSAIKLDQRCPIFAATKREMIGQLQNLLHEHNELVRLFKTALDTMHSDDHKIIIRADKRPSGSHSRQFNAPTINEVAVVIVGENVASHDIVLERWDGGQLQRVYETHRSYDALQYPLMSVVEGWLSLKYKDGQSNDRFAYRSSFLFHIITKFEFIFQEKKLIKISAQ